MSRLVVLDTDDLKTVLTVKEYKELCKLIDKVADNVGTKNYTVREVKEND